jgi:hypothetical protein
MGSKLKIDKMLESWEMQRFSFPEKLNCTESGICLHNSLTASNPLILTDHCRGCKLIKSLMDGFNIGEGMEIILQTGKKEGSVLKFFQNKGKDNTITQNGDNVTTENNFLNYTIISSIVEKLYKKKGYPYFPTYLWSYTCNNSLNVIVNITGAVSVKTIGMTFPRMESLFKQTLLNCHFLSSFKFSHGEPSIQHISLFEEKVNYSFQGVKVSSEILLTLQPSVKSSITYKNKRYHHEKYKKNYTEPLVECRDVKLNHVQFSGNFEDHKIYYYKIGHQSEKFLVHISTGYYQKSFDYVMFLASLVSESTFYDHFKDSPYLYIWRDLWKKEEYDLLMEELRKLKGKTFFNSLFGVIRKYYIREDALEFSMKSMKKIPE